MLAQDPPYGCYSGIVHYFVVSGLLLFFIGSGKSGIFSEEFVSIGDHGPKLICIKMLAPKAYALGGVGKDRPTASNLNENCGNNENRGENNKKNYGANQIYYSFYNSVPHIGQVALYYKSLFNIS